MGIRTFRVINGNRHIEQTAKKFGLLNGLLGNLVEFYAVFLVFVQTENGL